MKKIRSLLKLKSNETNMSVFYYMLLSYVVLIGCFLLFMGYTFSYSKTTLNTQINSAHQGTFSSIGSFAKSFKNGLDSYARQISNNETVYELANKEQINDIDSLMQIYDVDDFIKKLIIPADSAKEVAFYFPKSNSIMINSSVFKADSIYTQYYIPTHMAPNTDFDSWKKFMLEAHTCEMYSGNNGQIFFLYSVKASADSSAMIIITVNDSTLRKLFPAQNRDSGVTLYNHNNDVLFTSSGNTSGNVNQLIIAKLSDKNEETSVDDKNYFIFTSKINNRLYISYHIDKTTYDYVSNQYSVRLFILIFVMLIIAAFLAAFFSKSQYRTISDIVSSLKKLNIASEPELKNEYNYIQKSISHIARKHEKTQKALELQTRKTIKSAMRNAITMHTSSMFRPSRLIDLYDPGMKSGAYVLAIISINYVNDSVWDYPGEDSEHITYSIDNIFSDVQALDFNSLCIQLNENMALMLMGTNHTDTEKIYNSLRSAYMEVHNICETKLDFNFSVHISSTFTDINKIHDVYEHTIAKRFISDNSPVTFQHEADDKFRDNSPISESDELMLENYLICGDAENFNIMISKLFENNTHNTLNSAVSLMKMRIINIFISIMNKVDFENFAEYTNLVYQLDSKKSTLNNFIDLANYVCEFSAQRIEATSSLADQVVEYVNKNFSDKTLNVNNLSYYFNKNPSYLSTVFKNETGKMLNNYITEVRIGNAKQYIRAGKKIEEAAILSGYSDVVSFRRAFKRITGITPSDYRKHINEENS